MKKRLLVSFSSGETSAFMAYWIKENLSDDYEIIFVFANTGEENEESLVFADRCDEYFGLNLVWIEAVTNPEMGKGNSARVVSFETADRNGKPFEEMMAKRGIVNVATPQCSRELKDYAIRAYARQIGWSKYFTAIGIRIDEVDRVNPKYKSKRLLYPLISMHPMTKPAINRYWRNMPFRLTIKGYEDNCKVCWKKSLRKLLTIAKHTPERFDNFRKWEKMFGDYIPESRKGNKKLKPPFRFYRDNLSVDEIIQLSKNDFEEAPDDRMVFKEYVQTSLFGYDLDIPGGGCDSESCEAFN